MYIDKDTQDCCRPACPPSSPPEPGGRQRPHSVMQQQQECGPKGLLSLFKTLDVTQIYSELGNCSHCLSSFRLKLVGMVVFLWISISRISHFKERKIVLKLFSWSLSGSMSFLFWSYRRSTKSMHAVDLAVLNTVLQNKLKENRIGGATGLEPDFNVNIFKVVETFQKIVEWLSLWWKQRKRYAYCLVLWIFVLHCVLWRSTKSATHCAPQGPCGF